MRNDELLEVLNEAAGAINQAVLTDLGITEGEYLLMCRAVFYSSLLDQGVDQKLAEKLAQKFANTVAYRRHQIATSAGANLSRTVQ